MSGRTLLSLRGRNPDVLTCIANLSNDEVFTPPELANRILDAVAETWAANHGGVNIWSDSSVRFLDPCTKEGVFLREITSRLTKGLVDEMPDLEKRVDHILTEQVFGIGITRLTSLLARRSVYCSKHAMGQHSIAGSFESDDGNIWFERVEHTWADGKCQYCGASQKFLDRGEDLETHAYAFIHTDDIAVRAAEMFGGHMQFDVIVGNPPYQLDDGGFGTSSAPIYHKFVEQAKRLEPRLLAMIIPSRWFAGGKGLDEFREAMLTDDRVRSIDDFLSASDVFRRFPQRLGRVSRHRTQGWRLLRPLGSRQPGAVPSGHPLQGVAGLHGHASVTGSRGGCIHPLQRRTVDSEEGRRGRDRPVSLAGASRGNALRSARQFKETFRAGYDLQGQDEAALR
jgi:site-specific DNA-methyltransferase (adenine-specific)